MTIKNNYGIGKFYLIYYDERNHRSKPPYLRDTCLSVYTEGELKRMKQKHIEQSVYCMMRWLKFKKRKIMLALIQKKINEL